MGEAMLALAILGGLVLGGLLGMVWIGSGCEGSLVSVIGDLFGGSC